MSDTTAFKCINHKCRNIAFVKNELCMYCKETPFGYTKQDLAMYGDLPFEEMQRIMEEEKRKIDKANIEKRQRENYLERMQRPRIILPHHFMN